MNKTHHYWMKKAIDLAEKAKKNDEVPVGALIVNHQNELLSESFNQCISKNDPTAHGEILAIRQACEKVHNYRLTGCHLYVTIQPCLMCLTAAMHARVSHIFFGAFSKKRWPIFPASEKEALWKYWHQSQSDQCLESQNNVQKTFGTLTMHGNVLDSECSALLQEFFSEKRRSSSKRTNFFS